MRAKREKEVLEIGKEKSEGKTATQKKEGQLYQCGWVCTGAVNITKQKVQNCEKRGEETLNRLF